MRCGETYESESAVGACLMAHSKEEYEDKVFENIINQVWKNLD
jgi:hypothetical protein